MGTEQFAVPAEQLTGRLHVRSIATASVGLGKSVGEFDDARERMRW